MVRKRVTTTAWSRKLGFHIFSAILKDLADICDSFTYRAEARVLSSQAYDKEVFDSTQSCRWRIYKT